METTAVSPDIELRFNNPYSNSSIIAFNQQEKELRSFDIQYKKSSRDRYYQVDDNENYSDISFKAYGDSKYWWVLYLTNYNLNPDLLLNPFIIPMNTYLLIPDLETFKLQNNG